MPLLHRKALVTVALVWLVSGASMRADEASKSAPLVDAMGDPVALGRAVERLGDDHVIERLGEDAPLHVRRAAVAASPWLRAPEAALGPLSEVAAGRDPHLAPAAADAAHAIATAIDQPTLARREARPNVLVPAGDRLARLAEDPAARADVRYVAGFAADALLQVTTVPGGEDTGP